MDSNRKNGFEQIEVSERLDSVIDKAIDRAKKDKKKKLIKSNIIKYSAAVASLFIVFIASIKFIPVFAQVLNNVAVGSSVTREAKFYFDQNIGMAVNEGLAEDVNESETNKNIKVTVNSIIADDKNAFIFYTLNGKMDKQGFKNLLLQNLKIYDDRYNILLDSKSNYYPKLPDTLYKKDGDFLLTFNDKYRCIISSIGDNVKNYSQNNETYGAIELTATNGHKMPSELNLKLLSFTEAYQMSYSKEKYNSFVSKYYRNPMSINGEWNFNIKIDKNLKETRPEAYNNIKFYADHTDFNIKFLKIYPTHIETKIIIGKNKLTGAQCYSIGQDIKEYDESLPYLVNDENLPYLVDEKGNKYKLTDTEVGDMDSDKMLDLTFQSCYFNSPEELYLVVNRLNYESGSENFSKDIGEVKIRIK
ncbi:DUF4179 domain-containing protein [Clostridium sp. PL3]|uniref:DUF4179 domain-containing protein n=1 Tax=Clostridium thailandense TaxID=2794346 RepID=A0A949U347_9CLOT|nr:DUF4179 domain-containing protein [Clostridium thailandense]MBV7275578.1 DUF4179 domain-containing protein [Clostridium thailandense]